MKVRKTPRLESAVRQEGKEEAANVFTVPSDRKCLK